MNPPPLSTGAGSAKKHEIGLLPALSANVLNMVGIGPFITIPLVIGAMGGPQAMAGWALGALIALCDGLVWAEFGSALPSAGGSYRYLRESFGRETWGRFLSFLFLCQTLISAPLTAASGAVGFADYASYLFPDLTGWHAKGVAVAVCVLATLLLYRNIEAIGKISLLLTAILLCTMGWIILAGATHFHPQLAFDFPTQAFHLSRNFFLGLGSATLIAMYDYSGYFNVCLIGAEIRDPARNISRCILISILGLGICYAAMSFSILGVVPWRKAMQSKAIVADFFQQVSGPAAAQIVTILILIAAFGSVYTVLLGFSRVPYAAASEGQFPSIFAKLHPVKRFPSVSILVMGGASVLACFFSLGDLIKALLVLQILTQFIAQCVGLVCLRRFRPDIPRPFRMILYPVPVAIALAGWIFVVASSGVQLILECLGGIAVGFALYLLWAKRRREWPFRQHLQPFTNPA